MSTSPPSTPCSRVSGLRWSIKREFLRYVARMPDGRCSVTDGAVVADDTFLFVPDQIAAHGPAAGTGVLRFRGDVRFAGHHGLLFVRIADPWLTVDHEVATLTIAGSDDAAARIPLVTVTLTAGDPFRHFSGTDARLTSEGSELFGTVYSAGERFDDLTVLTASEDTP
jgi:hypothetical protein